MLALPGEQFRLHAAPEELRRHVVLRSELPTNPGEFGRLLITVLAVQDLSQDARSRGKVIAFPHLLKSVVILTELAFSSLEIAGQHFDERRVEGGQGGKEPVSELLEQRPAPPVAGPGRPEIATHRLKVRERHLSDRRGPPVISCS